MIDRNLLKSKLALFPVRAQVSFAVRCARRVQPLFDLQAAHPDRTYYCRAVDEALTWTESFALSKPICDMTAARRAIAAADGDTDVDRAAEATNHVAASAARATAAAYEAASFAARADAEASDIVATGYAVAVESVTHAAAEAAAHAADAADVVVPAMERDLSTLFMTFRVELATIRELPIPDEPFDASANGPLGPLWQDSVPQWYAVKRSQLDQLLSRR